jgi:hypothetical protein
MWGAFITVNDHLHELLGIWGTDFSLVDEKDKVTQLFVSKGLLNDCLKVLFLFYTVAIDMIIHPK